MTGKNFKQAIIYSIKGLDKDHLANKKFNKFMQKQQKKKRVCTHSRIRKGLIEYNELRCFDCGKTWRYNDILKYWSDSFVGIFKKDDNKQSEQ